MADSKRNIKSSAKKLISPLEDPDLRLWALLDRTSDVIAKARDIELDHYKLSRVQASVLFILLDHGRGLTLSEIASYNVREPNSVLSLVNRMEKGGLVKKSKMSGEDKFTVIITEKGRKLYFSTSRLSLQMVFSVLSKKEREIFESNLKKLSATGREMLGLDYKPPFIPRNTL
jgi:MarR family transcriptional regulator, negative regulator of the multidrug operon emrRAB